METLILAHDIGTTGDKATLFRPDGTIRASSFAAYPTSYPKPGWAEQDADDYWRAFCAATRDLLAKSGAPPSSIGVISFSGQMMAALPVDGAGAALRPSIIWADQRSAAQVDRGPGLPGLPGQGLHAHRSSTQCLLLRDEDHVDSEARARGVWEDGEVPPRKGFPRAAAHGHRRHRSLRCKRHEPPGHRIRELVGGDPGCGRHPP